MQKGGRYAGGGVSKRTAEEFTIRGRITKKPFGPLEDVAPLVIGAVIAPAQGAGAAHGRDVAVLSVPVSGKVIVNDVRSRVADVSDTVGRGRRRSRITSGWVEPIIVAVTSLCG